METVPLEVRGSSSNPERRDSGSFTRSICREVRSTKVARSVLLPPRSCRRPNGVTLCGRRFRVVDLEIETASMTGPHTWPTRVAVCRRRIIYRECRWPMSSCFRRLGLDELSSQILCGACLASFAGKATFNRLAVCAQATNPVRVALSHSRWQTRPSCRFPRALRRGFPVGLRPLAVPVELRRHETALLWTSLTWEVVCAPARTSGGARRP